MEITLVEVLPQVGRPATIPLGAHCSVQGKVSMLRNGIATIVLEGRKYVGRPIPAMRRATAVAAAVA